LLKDIKGWLQRINCLRPGSPFNLSAYLQERQAQVEAALDGAIPVTYPDKIYEVRYSLLAGGKRLRPILCLTCEMAGGTVEMAMPTACAGDDPHHVVDPRRSPGDG